MAQGDDDHEHEGGHDHGSGLMGRLRELASPHSHDATDRVDAQLEASDEGIRALKISLVGLGVTALAQLGIVAISGSVALLADTVHNFADALTAVPLWIAFSLARRPRTDKWTYGYGRAEDLAGLVIVLAILASAILAGVESVQGIADPQPVRNVWWVFGAGVIGAAGNEAVALYRMRVGRRIGSAALVADGLHARTDGLTSLGVAVGALGVAAGYELADPIVGLLITVAIAYVLRDAARDVLSRLLDRIDPAIPAQVRGIAAGVDGVRAVHDVRARWIGNRLRAELDIRADGELSLDQAHALADEVEHELLHNVERLAAANVHVGPEHATATSPLRHHRKRQRGTEDA